MNQQSLKWLYQQLPILVEKGVITEETAKALQVYYGPIQERSRLIVFGLLGGGLIGAGVILLIANNWDFFSRGWRLALALLLLFVAQGIAFGVKQKSLDISWREGAALFWGLSVGATLALVSQTYHLSDDTNTFLLAWLLLILPVAYLMESAAVLSGYFALAVIWAGEVHFSGGDWPVWGLYAAMAPLFWRMWKRENWSGRVAFAGWCVTGAVLAGFAITTQRWLQHFSMLVFALFFLRFRWESFFFLPESKKYLTSPRYVIGTAGFFMVLFTASFRNTWRTISLQWQAPFNEEGVLLLILLLLLSPLLWRLIREKRTAELPVAVGAVALVAAYALLFSYPGGLPSAVLVNAYLIGFSVWQLVDSWRAGKTGGANQALLLLGAVILARFFDMQTSFLYRGIASILLGIGFLALNRRLLGKGGGRHE